MARWCFVLALFLVGCSSDPVPVVTQYSLAIKSDKSVNPSESNDSNPVVVRLYQLTDAQMFKQQPFIELYDNDVQLLSANMISKQILPVIIPGSDQTMTLDINKQTQYVAVFVEFIKYQKSSPKAVSMLPTKTDDYLQLTLSGDAAKLEIITPASPWWKLF
ncbi:type VI secretion system lipoprotein TssJ [Vibrio ostreicida]|uniref:Type VI secretion system lipoprotein TssJ n=1 Tax=Vibrio ostreicida TaxID=526588 RepID=A0ABT8BT33_9VIBR|nr:type VI secretion system lipoprotein TssJ [Vibrio ostreicida]MDN3610128.1 type VI secretion system lipoprotein TssJ [Vibrio ostreicida]NPD07847.1 type VI secretion system lipoprotein TssJ [Vibrio ostreicida]